MIASPQQNHITPEEYLQLELKSDVKHEYIDGYVYAMAGANDAHVTVALNLATLLRNHVRGAGCRVFMSDMKARIEKLNRYYYPDVMVTCDEKDRDNMTEKKYPCLIVEVLSDSTEAFDRGDKFADYQVLETLQEYVLINVKRPRVECFRRSGEGLWLLQSYSGSGETFRLESVGFEVDMNLLYEDVVFTG